MARSGSSDMKKVMEVIRRNRRFMVSAHVNPEGDALGSAFSLASLLRRLGKQAFLGQDGGIPSTMSYLPRLVPVTSRPGSIGKVDVSVIVDVPLISRTGSFEKVIQKAPTVVNIDHHVSNQRFADVNWVDPKAAAVGEMIYRLYEAFRVKPTREEAMCLYVSLVTDTGSFRYMNTTPEVHRIVAKLLARGVSPLKVSQILFESRSPNDLRFLGKVLSGIRHTADGKIAWIEVPMKFVQSYRAGADVQDELVNFPRSVQTAEIAFILRETEERGKIRASLRSKGNVNVDRVARAFGGGGHIAASGCTIEGTLAQARAKLLKVARQALKGVRRLKP